MRIDWNLRHKNLNRLEKEFLKPLKRLLDKHAGATITIYRDPEDGERALHVELWSSSGKLGHKRSLGHYTFQTDGKVFTKYGPGSHPYKTIKWPRAGREIMEIMLAETEANIKKMMEQVKKTKPLPGKLEKLLKGN